MSFDTSWEIDFCKRPFESSDQWQFRREFLIANKNKYPIDRLVALSHIFANVEFMECKYPKPTMDLIENLSKGFVDGLRIKLGLKAQKFNVTVSNAAEAKDNENAQATTSDLKNNQPPSKKMRYLTPFDSNSIIPGFMLKITNGLDYYTILEQSCIFSEIAKPEIKYEHSSRPYIQTKLYIQKQLIAVGAGKTKKMARMDVSGIAFFILKEMCFGIKVKKIDTESQISYFDFIKDSTINTSNKAPNSTSNYNKISDNNLGNMILKNMGWKEGDGLGKNNQGIKSPIEVIHLKKRAGLGVTNDPETVITNLQNFKIEANKYIAMFLDSPKTKLSFTTDFTKDERKIIHSICIKNNRLRTRSYGKNTNRRIEICKKQTPYEIFYELSDCSNFENDSYILEPPMLESST